MIFRHTVFYIAGEIFNKILPFLLVPFLTKYLGLSEYTIFARFQLYHALSLSLLNIGLDVGLNRYYVRYGVRGYDLLLKTSLRIAFALFALQLIVLVIFASPIIGYYSVALAFINTIFLIILSTYQIRSLSFNYFIASFIYVSASSAITVLLICFVSKSYEFRVVAMSSGFVFAVLYFVFDAKFSLLSVFRRVRFYNIYIYYYLSFSLPLVVHNVSGFLKLNADRLIADQFFSNDFFSVYSAAVTVASSVNIFLIAVNKAVTPYIFANMKSDYKLRYESRIWFVTVLVALFSHIFLSMLPDYLYSYVFGQDFIDMQKYISILVPLYLFQSMYLFYANFMFYHGYTVVVTIASLISVAVYLMYCAGVVYFQLESSKLAFSSLFSIGISTLVMMLFYRKYIREFNVKVSS